MLQKIYDLSNGLITVALPPSSFSLPLCQTAGMLEVYPVLPGSPWPWRDPQLCPLWKSTSSNSPKLKVCTWRYLSPTPPQIFMRYRHTIHISSSCVTDSCAYCALQELPTSGASLHVSPPVTTSAVRVLSTPAVCLNITVTACPVEPTLPSLPSLPLEYRRLTRALAAGSRDSGRPPPPKPCEWMCELGIFLGGSYGFLSTVSSTGHNRSLPIRNRKTSSVPGMPCSDGGHYLFLILYRFLGAAVGGGWFQCRHSCSPTPTPHPYLSVRSFSVHVLLCLRKYVVLSITCFLPSPSHPLPLLLTISLPHPLTLQPVSMVEDNGLVIVRCKRHLITRLLIGDVLLLVAYLWGLYIFHFKSPEYLATLMETVSFVCCWQEDLSRVCCCCCCCCCWPVTGSVKI